MLDLHGRSLKHYVQKLCSFRMASINSKEKALLMNKEGFFILVFLVLKYFGLFLKGNTKQSIPFVWCSIECSL